MTTLTSPNVPRRERPSRDAANSDSPLRLIAFPRGRYRDADDTPAVDGPASKLEPIAELQRLVEDLTSRVAARRRLLDRLEREGRQWM